MSNIDDKMLEDLLTAEMPQKNDKGTTMAEEKDRSLKFACVGVGQAGSRIAEVFYKLGYPAVVLNTASQDLKYIQMPENKKMFIDLGLAGAGKDLARGEDAIVQNKATIYKFLETEFVDDSEMLFLAISGGGGTGAGSVVPMVELLSSFGRPLGIIYILPLNTDDATAKKNSLTTLARLAKLASTDVINTLLVVDNAKIEAIYGNLPQNDFWKISNEAIVAPLHLFNVLTNQPSQFTSLDSSDFGKIISFGDCSVCGVIEVENYEDETALAEAALNSLENSMLASSFDLKQTKVGGVLVVGRPEVLGRVPANNLNFLFHVINEKTDNASLYKGIYGVESDTDNIKIYCWFAGLGLPLERINVLKAESVLQDAKAEDKLKARANTMSFDIGDKTTTAAQEIHQKIKAKNSAFNKLTGNVRSGIIDRRKK